MIDAYTDTWRGVAAKCNEAIEASRSRLEATEQSYGESQFLRGRIAAMREILDLVEAGGRQADGNDTGNIEAARSQRRLKGRAK